MFHPLADDLSKLTDSEVEEKLQELTRKYFAAQRLGNRELLTQLSTFVTMYRQEMSRRHLNRTNPNLDKDLDQLINVD